MSWASLPYVAAARVHASTLDDIRAAIIERQADVGGSAPAAAPSGTKTTLTAAWLNDWRAKVQALVPLYYDPATGNAWTMTTVRAAASLSGTDWYRVPPGYSGGPTYGTTRAGTGNARDEYNAGTTYALNDVVNYLGQSWKSLQAGNLNHAPSESAWWTAVNCEQFYAAYLNELYVVLKLLRWVWCASGSSIGKLVAGAGNSMTSFAVAWANAKTAYHSAAWGAYGGAETIFYGGKFKTGLWYWGYMNHIRNDDLAVAVPNYSVEISAAKAVLESVSYGGAAGSVDLYAQANFGGAAANHAITGGGIVVWDVDPVQKGVTVHYSYHCHPYDANPNNDQPNPDSYEPTDPVESEWTYKGFGAVLHGLLCQLGYTYV